MTGKRKTKSLKGWNRNVPASRIWKGEKNEVNHGSSAFLKILIH